ncbi:MAG TPA: pseudouridine synthase [Thermoanaerobaculia bacterium]|nr:pseudouridine synthase [Thermoanaerobaculia bacterium]
MIHIHDSAPSRLDLALAQAPLGISRREAKRLIDELRVVVDGRLARIASREVRRGGRIALLAGVPELPLLSLEPERVAIDKPPGLASQMPRRNGPLSVLEVLPAQLARAGEPHELWVVHRLDTGTSGVLLLARTRREAARLSHRFAAHEIEKTYVARIHGRLESGLELGDPIARAGAARFTTSPSGRPARTIVRPLEPGSDSTLVAIEIATGRTHQIRVHLAAAGHPIVGDVKYGGPSAARLHLHAWRLAHPDLGRFEAPIPERLRPRLPPG